jgi:hypothetical protein
MNSIARNQANKLRFVRQAIPPIDMPQGSVDSIPGHRVQRNDSLSIHPNQHLQPLQMLRLFFLHKEQTNDVGVLTTAIEFAAADIRKRKTRSCKASSTRSRGSRLADPGQDPQKNWKKNTALYREGMPQSAKSSRY